MQIDQGAGKVAWEKDMALRVSGYGETVRRLHGVTAARDPAADPSSSPTRNGSAAGMDDTG